MSFVHLHTHTAYSLLDGSNRIKDYVAKVVSDGQNAAAITDHGVMYGCIEFYKEAKKQGINPVIGCEIYVAPGSRFDRERVDDEAYYHLILLAENNTGYGNLMKIVSTGFAEGFYRKPRVDFETLEKYHEGLICLSACLAGQVQRELEKGNYEGAKELAEKYDGLFGRNNYFLELQDHGLPMDRTVISGLLRIHTETGIPVVCTNDCHYTNAEDAEAHDILLCIQTKKKVQDADRMRYEGGQYYVKSEEEMRQLFSYIPEAIDNTQAIADRCHVEIEFGVTKLPRFEVPETYDSWTYLNKLCGEGLSRRYPDLYEAVASDHGEAATYVKFKEGADGEKAKTYSDRLSYELSVIQKMGYVDYFLIVWDFIHFAKSHGIPVGPGRGSAAGSLVSYTTEITNIDPMKYDLIFERFLNPERVSMPDIDVDIADDRRSEVIDYVRKKYGDDCVCQIVTFGTMAAKNAIRDVGRAMDLSYSLVDSVAKEIPDRLPDLPVTIENSVAKNPHLKEMYEGDPAVRDLIDTAKKLEGLPRNASMHAAGVIISREPMETYVPLARVMAGGPLVTQYEKGTVEELGLLKMDFLGLRTLTVISDCCDMVEENHGVRLDMDHIDFMDRETFQTIAAGKCEGIFQLESSGMKSFMTELRPETIEDVIAGISLYRPGPMDFIPRYLKGRRDRDHIHYDTPELEPILKNTFGCMVYQEQVMQIVRDLGGFSLARSDLVRKAMSKKKTEVMQEERQNFVYGNEAEGIEGCIKKGIPEEVANHIYDEMIDFGKYAFNKSHAAGYAVVAFQTAYLRTHYPAEFFAAMMTSVLDRTPKVAEYIGVVRDMGIKVLPPDVNLGSGPFTVEDGNIRFGMYAVKSIGPAVIDAIVDERQLNGPYGNLSDFIERVHGREINKKAIENLIKAGALDCFEGNRRQKLMVYSEILDSVNDRSKGQVAGQISLFDIADETAKADFRAVMPNVAEFDKSMKLSFEKEVMGIYISGHPLEDYLPMLKKNATASSLDFILPDDEDAEKADDEDAVKTARIPDGKYVTIGGLVSEKTPHFTKNNQAMAFVTIEDMTGTVEIIFFPKTYEKYRDLLNEDEKLLVRGRASVEENKPAKLIAESVVPFEKVPSTLWVNFPDKAAYDTNVKPLADTISKYPGETHLFIYLSAEKARKDFTPQGGVQLSPGLIEDLKKTYGESKVFVSPGRAVFS